MMARLEKALVDRFEGIGRDEFGRGEKNVGAFLRPNAVRAFELSWSSVA
jgi:hypothetical protein